MSSEVHKLNNEQQQQKTDDATSSQQEKDSNKQQVLNANPDEREREKSNDERPDHGAQPSTVGPPQPQPRPPTPPPLPPAQPFEQVNGSRAPRHILKPPGELAGQRRASRKGSVVSFHERCELHEIDLERRPKLAPPRRPAAVFSLRYYIMLLALISPFVVTYSKTIINFAITDMVEPEYATTAATPAPATGGGATATADNSTTTTDGQQQQQAADHSVYFDHDNSCPVDELDRSRLLDELTKDKRLAVDRPGEKFQWDTVKQGFLKAAYSIGHALLPVFGSRLAEIFGSHWIMGLSSLLIGLLCLLAPWMAALHFNLMFADLFMLGVVCSFMTPAMITLFSHWLTPSEKTMMISLYLVSSRLGYALSSLLCGLLIQAQLSWRYLFHSAGWISLAFAGLFLALARSRPADHPFIKQEELLYLASKNRLVRERLAERQRRSSERKQQQVEGRAEISELKRMDMDKNEKQQQQHQQQQVSGATSSPDDKSGGPNRRPPASGAPWLAILTNVPVWAFITTKFCVKLAGDTVQIELPTYLKRVMHFSPKANGLINSSNYVIFCLSCLLVGALAKTANKRRPFGWSKTTLRKVFQSTASFGVALVLLGIAFSVCHNLLTQALLMLMFFFTTFGTGGEAQLPMDLSERYAGTIHAIASSLAVSGAIEPILVGFLLQGHASDRNSWSYVWLGASGVAAFGGLVFLIFGEATIQGFDTINDTSDTGELEDTHAKSHQTNKKPQVTSENGEKRMNVTNNTSNNLKGAENKAFSTDPPELARSDNNGDVQGGGGGGDSYRESAQI